MMEPMDKELGGIFTTHMMLMHLFSHLLSNIWVDHNSKDITMSKLSFSVYFASIWKFFSDCYRQYAQLSHNVLEQEHFARNRANRQARGAMDIAVALSKLPTTHHMKDTFIVDVFLHTNDLLGFTVQGLFLDGDLTKDPSPSYFSRSFLVSPRENKWVSCQLHDYW